MINLLSSPPVCSTTMLLMQSCSGFSQNCCFLKSPGNRDIKTEGRRHVPTMKPLKIEKDGTQQVSQHRPCTSQRCITILLRSPVLGHHDTNPQKPHCTSFTAFKIGVNSGRSLYFKGVCKTQTPPKSTDVVFLRCLRLNIVWCAHTSPMILSYLLGASQYKNLPNCWIALSALQGNSRVIWTRRLWFLALRSACNEIPELAASEMIAIFCVKCNKEKKIIFA